MTNKLIDDVDMPKDQKVEINQAFEKLKLRGCKETDLEYLKSIIMDGEIYDFSGYSGITTFLVTNRRNNEKNLCIKISDRPFELQRNYVIMGLMSKYNLFPKIIKFFSINKDYLITEAITYPMALNKFKDFRKLSEFMGKALRNFHDIQWDISSMTEEEKKTLETKSESILPEALSHEKGLKFLAQFQGDCNYDKMKEYLIKYQEEYIKDEVIIHGDFNPKNVFAKNDKLGAVVDLTDTCFGDRHYDICFSMWTVALYCGILNDSKITEECNNIFLDSYGRDKIDKRRMKYCEKLACMYWQEHNDINGLI